MKSRPNFKHLISTICLFLGAAPASGYTNTDALFRNRCAVLLFHAPAIIKASMPRPVLQRSERVQIEGKAGPISLEKITDIHTGLTKTIEQLEGIGLKVPTLTHVVLDPDSEVSPYAFPYALIRLRQERLIYLNGYNIEYEHQSGLQRVVANHEMIHTSMWFTFPYWARVNDSGFLREAFANFLTYHFDPDIYRQEAAFHSTNLEYDNTINMGVARQGRARTGFFMPTIWGNDHVDGLLLGYFLLRMRKLIRPENMNEFLRKFIPALNQYSLPDFIHADVELSGADRTSSGKVVMGHNHDLLLALALIDRASREWPSVQRLLTEFCASTDTGMSLERLHEIEKQLVPTRR